MKGIAGGDPVVGRIFGAAQSGDDIVPRREDPVGFRNEGRGEKVVRVEDEIAVEARGFLPIDQPKQCFECVTLADFCRNPGDSGKFSMR